MEQVSKDMMKELNTAKIRKTPHGLLHEVINQKSGEFRRISNWYFNADELIAEEAQLKLIKHIWLNDPQFEEEKPKKYVVRSKQSDTVGAYRYLIFSSSYGLKYTTNEYIESVPGIEKFNTREEAEEWTNPQTEVVEVEE